MIEYREESRCFNSHSHSASGGEINVTLNNSGLEEGGGRFGVKVTSNPLVLASSAICHCCNPHEVPSWLGQPCRNVSTQTFSLFLEAASAK